MLMYALRHAGVPVAGFKYGLAKIDAEDKAREGNPNGYWELGRATTETGIVPKVDRFAAEGDLIKVMFECVWKSNPNLIDKVIVIFRDPDKVVSSIIKNNDIKHPNLYILNMVMDTIWALSFLQYHKKDYRIVFYEDILQHPARELKKICAFIGGDWRKAVKKIDKKLDRSKKKHKYPATNLMRKAHKLAKEGDINGIIELKEKVEHLADKEL